MSLKKRLATWAKTIRSDGITLWFAVRHPLTPWYARLLGVLIVAYALSPIDLIPDFIPVLGYLDDVLLLPGLIWLVIRLIPPAVLQECRDKAEHHQGGKPTSRMGAVVIVVLWVGACLALWHVLVRHLVAP